MTNVADLQVGAEDSLGQKITCLYGRKAPVYGVYGAERRVMVCYADATETGLSDQQRRIMSALAPLRGEIDGLIDGWREGTSRAPFGARHSTALQSKADRYGRRVADALIVALEGDVPDAAVILATIKHEILDDRTARARFEYLIAAVLTAAALMFGAWLVASTFPVVGGDDDARRVSVGLVLLLLALLAATGYAEARCDPGARAGDRSAAKVAALRAGGSEPAVNHPTLLRASLQGVLLFGALAVPIAALLLLPPFAKDADAAYPADYAGGVTLWRAAAAGSIGAFFSIAIGIRGRTVLPDLLRTANLLDAALRVSIGFIGAGVLEALLRLHVVGLDLGRSRLGDGSLLEVLVAGFIAGFSERLVPDLLAKAAAQTSSPTIRPALKTPAPVPPYMPRPGDGGRAPGGGGQPGAARTDADPVPEQAGEDGCVAGHEIAEEDMTHDDQLPPAAGGVEAE